VNRCPYFSLPDHFCYFRSQAQIPDPVSEEKEQELAEKKRLQNKLKREKEKLKKLEKKEKQDELDEKERYLNMSDREKVRSVTSFLFRLTLSSLFVFTLYQKLH